MVVAELKYNQLRQLAKQLGISLKNGTSVEYIDAINAEYLKRDLAKNSVKKSVSETESLKPKVSEENLVSLDNIKIGIKFRYPTGKIICWIAGILEDCLSVRVEAENGRSWKEKVGQRVVLV